MATALVGRDGRLLAMVRSPFLKELHTIRVSEDKALTATTFRGVASRLLERDPMRAIRSALIWGGGRPINIGYSFCGGIGVADVPQNKKPGDVDLEHVATGIVAVPEEI